MCGKMSLAIGAVALLASTVNAHMKAISPVMYGDSTLNNSPLDASGSDFPCKQRPGVYDVTQMNNMEVGAAQELAFLGGATHSGGSCQISVTTDSQPNRNSVWKVIQSIHGGCPLGAKGNLSGDPKDLRSTKFQFSLPEGFPNGEYALAWTWFNKGGNREMYMNCAPITVTGGTNDAAFLSTLPDMFVANVGNGCATTENEDLVFPNPGQSVITTPGSKLGTTLIGSGCQRSSGGSTPVKPRPAPATNPGGIFIPVPPPATTTLSTIIRNAPTPIATPISAPVSAPLEENSTADPDSDVILDANNRPACNTPNTIVCFGPNHWGLCNIDNRVTFMGQTAVGMSCKKGKLAPPSVHARKFRRHAGVVGGMS